MRSIRRSSTHGPFLLDLLTSNSSVLALLAATTAAVDVGVGLLALRRRAVAQRGHPPRRARVPARGGGALAAAVRLVDRVHGDAARLRAHAQMPLATGLADRDVL